ncbi:MAG TPA: hypothetical protein VFT12_08015 [Thermoanaerobaculia bacterium]|nr:hypothetical protein [Thermoanaerobaculia bacterium]
MAAALWDSLRLRPADNDVAVMTMQNIDALAAAVESEAGSALEHEALRSIAARLRSRRDVPPPQRQADECRS